MKLTKNAIVFLLLSLITLSATIFAWVNISKHSETGPIGSDVTDFTNLITFYVKRSGDEDYLEITDIKEMYDVFGETRPGESYKFLFEFDNKTPSSRSIILDLRGVKTTNPLDEVVTDYDLRNVFYILDGVVDIYSKKEGELDFSFEAPSHQLIPHSNDPVTVKGQQLNLYRLNNLINPETGNLILTRVIEIEPNEVKRISFSLFYDQATEDIKYQDNMLKFLGFYIYGQ